MAEIDAILHLITIVMVFSMSCTALVMFVALVSQVLTSYNKIKKDKENKQ